MRGVFVSPARVVFLEDDGWRRLWPLTATRPVYDLRFGAWRLFEKTLAYFGSSSPAAWSPPARHAVTQAFRARVLSGAAGGPTVWWNGAARPSGATVALDAKTPALLRTAGGRVAGVWDPGGTLAAEHARELLAPGTTAPAGFTDREVEVLWIDHLWNLLDGLEEEIARDLHAHPRHTSASTPGGVWVLGNDLRLHETAHLDPGCVLDTRDGPIVVDDGARIESMTHLVGPAYVGPGTQLLGGRIFHASFGPECRVGGEVEAAIFQGFANKRHQGFLGHAVVGAWVNLGAMTSNSDLKNNYGGVRVWENGAEVDSGASKVGCFLGDHVKTGIGTLLTTGAVVGPGSNLFAGGRVTPRFLPGWSWWDGGAPQLHEWSRFLETARMATSRRGVELTPDLEAALLEAHAQGPRA